MFYYVLNTMKGNVKGYDLLEHVKQDNYLSLFGLYNY